MWPRGHAKSTHMDIFVPLWLMFQPNGSSTSWWWSAKVRTQTRCWEMIQAELEHNQRIIADFGKQAREMPPGRMGSSSSQRG